jgi:hypothetical protein
MLAQDEIEVIITTMREARQKWDDGIELAYLLNDVMDMNNLWQVLSKNDVSDMGDDLVNRMEAIRMSKRRDARRKPHPSRHKGVPIMITPEPYKSISGSVGGFVFAITQNRWSKNEDYPSSLVQEKGTEAQMQLDNAVNTLIGREVGVEDINPYLLKKSA